ncbi:MAG: hypothetical protein GQ565_11985 [Candidatus Aegiribacteria sp.]|nr:hypothetical protein [Candidatus Aegiribacteria sp.]
MVNTTGISSTYSIRLEYGRSLAVFWGWENVIPAESFFTSAGRQVLHRRYAGTDAPDSQNYQYASLMEEERKPSEE